MTTQTTAAPEPATDEATSPAPGPAAVGPAQGLPRLVLTLITLAIGLLIALHELDRLIRMVPAGPEGFAVDLSGVSAPRLPFPFPDATSQPWLAIHQLGMPLGGPTDSTGALVRTAAQAQGDALAGAWLGLDVVLALTYGTLLWLLLRRVVASGAVPADAPLTLLTRPRPAMAVAVVVAEIVENGLLAWLVLGNATEAPPTLLVIATALATSAKWLLLLGVAGQLGFALLGTSTGRTWLRRRAIAVATQRFSVLAFAPLAALALLPGAGVLDQLPDVQRTWFAAGDERPGTAPGWTHALAATVLLLLISFGLLLLGRLVADMATRRIDSAAPRPAPALRQWLYGPVVLALGLALSWRAGVAPISWWPLCLFAGIPLLIVLLSAWVRRVRPGLQSPAPRTYDAATAAQVRRLGDVLALSGLVVGSLALVRSHTVLLALGTGTGLQRALPVAGLVAAVATWWVGPWVIAQLQRVPWLGDLLTPGAGEVTVVGDDGVDSWGRPPGSARALWRLCWGLILVSTVAILAMASWPVWVAHSLGVIATVMLAMGALTLLVGSSVVLHLFYAPPQVFWLPAVRLREAPAATLLTLVVVAALLPGSSMQIHGIRGSLDNGAGTANSSAGAPTSAAAPAVSTVVADWLTRTEGCTVATPDGQPARPMVMVAAEGGGIRAAYWTAAALDQLRDQLPCGLDPVILGSGVSGGSVGLAVSRFSADQGQAVEQVWAMGGPDALAQGSLGLMVRDPLYSVTGLASGSDAPGDGWHDRAALMELDWEHAAPGLATDYFAPPRRPSGELAGALVLNSTATATGCRVLVSQVAFESGDLPDCADLGSPLAFSRDFAADYLPAGGAPAEGTGADPAPQHCIGVLKASTAAMLSARFPYVTPSGVAGPCGTGPEQQLIDGGYAEGSGLGTVVDLMPRLLREASAQAPDLRIVPIVVYLDNGRGSDLVQPPPSPVAELVVPLVGTSAAGQTQKDTPALLQRARGLTAAVAGPDIATVYVVTQPSKPAVEAPLGWVLSPPSRDDMDASLADGVRMAQARCGPEPESSGAPVESRPGRYPGLPELLLAMGACDR